MGVFKAILPREFLEDLTNLNVERFLKNGIDYFIFDFDNTLGLWKSCTVEKRFEPILAKILEANGKVLIASNGRPRQISLNGMKIIWRARKPFTWKIKRILDSDGIDPRRVVMIGDQIFTDVLAGNLLGVYTIKVKPLSNREFIGTKVLRFFEKIVLRLAGKGGRL
ncbi:MAG TPA: HAD hydrolase-like protein [Pseudothermotoga sp.]